MWCLLLRSRLHSTCSIEPDENENVVRRFLKAREKSAPGSWALEYSRQASPLTDGTDGAFVARLRRLQ
jgi:16S rRNA C967 or C1407 C5-methylase (RsmB/RsmF family)